MNPWLQSSDLAWRLAGLTMLHFLWIGAAIALLGVVLRRALRQATPAYRYAASLAVFTMLALAPAATATWLAAQPAPLVFNVPRAAAKQPSPMPPHPASHQLPITSDRAQPAPLDATRSNAARQTAIAPLRPQRPPASVLASPPLREDHSTALLNPTSQLLAEFAEILPWVWLIGAPLTFAWLVAGLAGAERWRRASTPLDHGPAADACRRLRTALHLSRRVAIAVCDGVAQPVLVGILRPVILLPAAALAGWTPLELEMALVHELAHVRRWDNLVNLLQRCIESLLFFHPAVWLVSRQVRRDREDCCDAIVVRHTRRPEAYATMLVSLAATLPPRRAAAMAVSSAMADHPLAARIRRILKLEEESMRITRSTLGVALVFIGLAISSVAVVLPHSSATAADKAKPAAAPDKQKKKGDKVNKPSPPSPSPYAGPQPNSPDQPNNAGPVWGEVQSITGAPIPFPPPAQHSGKEMNRICQALTAQGFKPVIETRMHEGKPVKTFRLLVPVAPGQSPSYVVQVVWEQNDQGLMPRVVALGATEQIGALIQQSRRTASPETLATLQAAVAAYRGQLAQLDSQLVALERQKQAALAETRSPAALDAAVKTEIENDAQIAAYRHSLADIEQKRQHLAESDDKNKEIVARQLAHDHERLNQEITQHLEQLEKAARERLSKQPNKALQDALREYDSNQSAIMNRREQLENQLAAATAQLAEEQDRTNPYAAPRLVLHDANDPDRKLRPRDHVHLDVVGAPADRPITDDYRIEPQGTLALGAAYGRVAIAGHTLLEAEELVKSHLKKTLTDVEVQLTLKSPATPPLYPAMPGAADPFAQTTYVPQPVYPAQPPATDVPLTAVYPQPTPANNAQAEKPQPPRYKRPTPAAPSAYATTEAVRSSTEQAIETKLATPIRPDFVEMPLSEVISVLSTEANLNLYLDPRAFEEAGVPQETPVTLVLPQQITIKSVLTLILEPLNLTFVIKDEVVKITTEGYATAQHSKSNAAQVDPQSNPFASVPTLRQNPITGLWNESEPPAAKNAHLYDGKTFDQWRQLLGSELKPERRVEAIGAIAAFGRAGHAAEAAEAILDVVEQYGPHDREPPSAGGLVYTAAIKALRSSIPGDASLPLLEKRFQDNAEFWEDLVIAAAPNASDQRTGKIMHAMLRTIAQHGGPSARQRALELLVAADPEVENEELIPIIDEKISSDDPEQLAVAMNALRKARRYPPRMLEALLTGSAIQQQYARQLLADAFNQAATKELQPQLLAELKTVGLQTTADDALPRIRAVAAAKPEPAKARPLLEPLFEHPDEKVRTAAAVAIEWLAGGHENAVELLVQKTGQKDATISKDVAARRKREEINTWFPGQ